MTLLLLSVIFWILLFLVVHPWVFYPLILQVFTMVRGVRQDKAQSGPLPSVSIIIAAYNAAGVIVKKLRNTLELEYAADKLEIIVVSDGSKDATVTEARSIHAQNVHVFALDANRGKSSAQNEGVQQAKGDIIVLTDVDSELDKEFLLNLVPQFADPQVACVGGQANYRSQGGTISSSQGFYSKLEKFIRSRESELGMLFSLPGWAFAIRRTDLVPLDPDTGDDMILPMEMALRGKRSVIARKAIVFDSMPATVRGEMKARQRITLRNLTGLMRRRQLLNPLLYPRMSFAIWSHKLLRWLAPLLMLLLLLISLVLTIISNSYFFALAFWIQVAGYVVSAIGFIGIDRNVHIPIAGHFASFLLANIGFFIGVMKYAFGVKIRSYSNSGVQ